MFPTHAKSAVFIAAGVLGLLGLYGLIRGRLLIKRVRRAVALTQPYQRLIDEADQHVVVLGDSTMYGAGVDDEKNTIGGFLAQKFPEASIETLARNGAKVKNLHDQLEAATYQHYKLAVIGVGGNDIVFLSRYKKVRQQLRVFLDEAGRHSDKIVLVHSVNLGNIGFFKPPLSLLYDYRTRQLSRMYEQVSKGFPNVSYVNFYRPKHADHYTLSTRHAFIARDGIHPSEYANKYFFKLIEDHLE